MEVSVFCQTWQNVDMKLDGGDIAAAAAAAAIGASFMPAQMRRNAVCWKGNVLPREAKE